MDILQRVGRKRQRLFGLFPQDAIDIDAYDIPVPAHRRGDRRIELNRLRGTEIIFCAFGRIVGKGDEKLAFGRRIGINRQGERPLIARRQKIPHRHFRFGEIPLFEPVNQFAFRAQAPLRRKRQTAWAVSPVSIRGKITVQRHPGAVGGGNFLRPVELHMQCGIGRRRRQQRPRPREQNQA
ncbi:hypothetical protein SDC9_185604 [bioreactor metagenome]|uniref:Uncharacterized protein n=1 Tax=bioreactor metagenome TaxID=1076179 RepID=A0A645HGE1_9ZZZZ